MPKDGLSKDAANARNMHALKAGVKISRSIPVVKLNSTATSWYVRTPNSIVACQSRRPE